VVFSQFVNFLDIIEWRLQKSGFRCVKLDGRMTPTQRDSMIKAFMTLPQITVFLVSLKAGGVAINLAAAANHCFLMDPWWNPGFAFLLTLSFSFNSQDFKLFFRLSC